MSGQESPPEPADQFHVPDDISGLFANQGGEVDFAALMTQIAGAEPLAAACVLAKISAMIAPSSIGALAVLETHRPNDAAAAASGLSTLIKGVPLILVTRTHGQLTMVRYLDGAAGDQLAPGLVVSGAPTDVESLLMGTVAVEQMDNVLASSSISRWKAMRLLTAAARQARRS